MLATAALAVPLGIAAALHLEEFADKERWWNRFIEVNLQNLAAVPSIVYGLLALAVMALLGFERKGNIIGGSIALALLILPVIIITTREAVRAVPEEIRHGVAGARRHGVADHLEADAARPPYRASRPAPSSGCPARSARRRRCCCSASPGRSASTPTG